MPITCEVKKPLASSGLKTAKFIQFMTSAERIHPRQVLLTGASGLLGTELRRLAPDLLAPSHEAFDLTDAAGMADYLANHSITAVIHAAATTSPPDVARNPVTAMRVNIAGTAQLAALCLEAGHRFVYISTDYVFKGDRGLYKETDELLPQNAYAWSKLGGESAAQMVPGALILRTSFSPAEFPHARAFVDQYTSRDSVTVIAPIILELALQPTITGIVHVGTGRKTVRDLALLLGRTDVGELRRDEVDFEVPKDTSLDISKLNKLLGAL